MKSQLVWHNEIDSSSEEIKTITLIEVSYIKKISLVIDLRHFRIVKLIKLDCRLAVEMIFSYYKLGYWFASRFAIVKKISWYL